MPPMPARSIARRSRSGPLGSGGSAQVKVRGKWKSSGGSSPSGRSTTTSSKASSTRGSTSEGEVEVEGAVARLLGMQVDLPGLAQRVGLHEVPLVVHVEPVVHRVVLELGHVSSDIDDRHPVNPTRPEVRDRTRTWAARRSACERTFSQSSTRRPTRWPKPGGDSTTGASPAPATASTAATWWPTQAALEVTRPRRPRRSCPRSAVGTIRTGRSWSWSIRSTVPPTPSRGSAVVGDQPVRAGRRRAARRGGRQPGHGTRLEASVAAGPGATGADRARRVPLDAARPIVALSGLPPALARVVAVPLARCRGPRPVRRGQRVARRLHRLRPDLPRPVGLPRRSPRLPRSRERWSPRLQEASWSSPGDGPAERRRGRH